MDATLERDGGEYVLTVERRLAEPPEKVWRALTDRKLLVQWFPCDVEGEWAVGSPLRFEFLHGEDEREGLTDEDMRGEVLAVDEPRLLRFRWGTEVLTYELFPDDDGCLFRLSHRLEDPSWGARNAAGWEMCLENLDLLIEGAALARFAAEVWKTKFRHYVARFERAFGPQMVPPEGDPRLVEEAEA